MAAIGVADANAARERIAQNYMKTCQYFWIVSPITRAVDEKVAHGTETHPWSSCDL